MDSIHDFQFHNMTSLGDDKNDLSQKTVQNSHASTYMLTNYKTECPMNSAIDFATQNKLNYEGSHQVGINGCNVEESNKLLRSTITNPGCRYNLEPRPYTTVPYLGKGIRNPVLSSQLQQGEYTINRKSTNLINEMDLIDYRQIPMIPSLKATINNPANLVEGVAAEGWVRGGVPSRLLKMGKDYD